MILLLVQGMPFLTHLVQGLEPEHLTFLTEQPSQGLILFEFWDRLVFLVDARLAGLNFLEESLPLPIAIDKSLEVSGGDIDQN